MPARRVFIEPAPGGLASTLVLAEQQVNHGVRRVLDQRLALCLQVLGGLLADMAHEAEGNFVGDRQRSDWHASLARLGLDHRRADAFTQHGNAFIGERAEHPRGEETPTVVDDDRGFADLQDEIEPAGQGFVAGAGALDDFHQWHFFHGAEEMQANELARVRHRGGEATDRQGRGVGGDQCIGAHHFLRGRGDFGLQLTVLEYRFDDQVATRQIGIVVSGMDARQHGLTVLDADLPARHFLVQQRS